MTDSVLPVVHELAALLNARQWRLVTAESCTGGLIGGACTELAGSSTWFERGYVTYSNHAKVEALGVPKDVLRAHGAVSEATAEAMVKGALAHAHAQVALAVTGVAGPAGGTADRPVGTVCFGWALPGRTWTEQRHFEGDRRAVRQQTVAHSLQQLVDALRALPPA